MFRPEEYDILDKQIKLLLHQGVIEPTYHSSPEFISNIFWKMQERWFVSTHSQFVQA